MTPPPVDTTPALARLNANRQPPTALEHAERLRREAVQAERDRAEVLASVDAARLACELRDGATPRQRDPRCEAAEKALPLAVRMLRVALAADDVAMARNVLASIGRALR